MELLVDELLVLFIVPLNEAPEKDEDLLEDSCYEAFRVKGFYVVEQVENILEKLDGEQVHIEVLHHLLLNHENFLLGGGRGGKVTSTSLGV